MKTRLRVVPARHRTLSVLEALAMPGIQYQDLTSRDKERWVQIFRQAHMEKEAKRHEPSS